MKGTPNILLHPQFQFSRNMPANSLINVTSTKCCFLKGRLQKHCWWTVPGGGESGRRSNDVLSSY